MNQFSIFNWPQLKIHHWPKEYQAAMEAFLQSLYDRSQSMSTVNTYALTLAMFFNDGRAPEQYTRTDCAAFLHRPLQGNRRHGQPPSTGCMNQRLSILSSWFKFVAGYWIIEDGKSVPLYNQAIPTLGIRRGKAPRVHRTFAEGDLELLLSQCDRTTTRGARDFAMFLFYLATGRRASEVAGLRWPMQETTFPDGRGGRRSAIIYTWSGKGKGKDDQDKSECPVECYQAILEYLTISGRRDTIAQGDPIFIGDPLPWIGGDPYAPIAKDTIWLRLRHYAKLAGIPVDKYTLHCFRHQNTKERLAAGEPLADISKALRHASIATTAIYCQQLAGTQDETASRIARRWAGYRRE